MVIVVFRSKLRAGIEDEFNELGDRMQTIAESMPGFISYKVFHAPDGERASIIEFESREELQAWKINAEHIAAQQLGRDKFYAEYTLTVSETLRETKFER
ncbi:MAG: antibiotic biosynthesis monooxygenase [Myxococcales bacterium]|nr:antibiotic biosynthesis monooxygenase [Myxococcales bacterium]